MRAVSTAAPDTWVETGKEAAVKRSLLHQQHWDTHQLSTMPWQVQLEEILWHWLHGCYHIQGEGWLRSQALKKCQAGAEEVLLYCASWKTLNVIEAVLRNFLMCWYNPLHGHPYSAVTVSTWNFTLIYLLDKTTVCNVPQLPIYEMKIMAPPSLTEMSLRLNAL